jgi:8-amino-7-oxononanoate synthase
MKEGIHAAPAERYRAEHNDLDSVEDCLKRARGSTVRDIWIAVESVFSMDGDLAPLAELQSLAERYDATLIVDEAHATGVFGTGGRGLCEALPADRLITVHTCGKALGVAGALVCASRVVIDYLINKARPFIYSTAPPPLLAAALICALDLVEKEPWRRERLQAMTRFAADQLRGQIGEPVRFGGSQIIPILLGEDARALAVARQMQNEGFDVRAIRPPTVPQGSARLRMSLNAMHSESDIASFTDALELALDVTEEPE